MRNASSFRPRRFATVALCALIALPVTAHAASSTPVDPTGVPSNLVNERTKIHDDFMALRKQQNDLSAQCSGVHTQADLANCGQQQQSIQTQMNAIQARSQAVEGKIKDWRQQQGAQMAAAHPNPGPVSTGTTKPTLPPSHP